ncbi:MAG: glycoside hydrolase family 3 protein [Myxococcota bacterium]
MGQMLLVGFGGRRQSRSGDVIWRDPHGAAFDAGSEIARDIAERRVGGVILFSRPARDAADAARPGRNIESPMQLATLVAALRKFSAERRARAGLEPIPLLVAIDQEGGRVDRLPTALGFSQRTVSARALGGYRELAVRDPEADARARELTHAYASAMAAQLRSLGVDLDLAPCVDVNANPSSPAIGRFGRSFSSDPELVAQLAWEFSEAFHEQGVLATLKHFPGHGSAAGDSHRGFVDATPTYQAAAELQPYRALIARGYRDVILVGHLVNGALDRTQCRPGAGDDPRSWCPASMSRATVTGLLRGELGFQGVVAADEMAMGAIARDYPLEVALERAIDAGVELFIVGNHTRPGTNVFVDTIAQLVESGRVDPERIRRASESVRALKRRL